VAPEIQAAAEIFGLCNWEGVTLLYGVTEGNIPQKPQRIQLRRTKGWRMPPDTVKVDRSTPWGNPFVVGRDGDQAECFALFVCLLAGECGSATERAYHDRAVANRDRLKGKNLACWCKPGEPCHADALLRFANGP